MVPYIRVGFCVLPGSISQNIKNGRWKNMGVATHSVGVTEHFTGLALQINVRALKFIQRFYGKLGKKVSKCIQIQNANRNFLKNLGLAYNL